MPIGSPLLPLLLLPFLSVDDPPQPADDPPAPQETADDATTDPHAGHGAPDAMADEEEEPFIATAQPTEQRARWFTLAGEEWRSVDDPGAYTLPKVLTTLGGVREGVFAAVDAPRYLLIRRWSECAEVIDAFIPDEEAMNREGEFIPVADRPLDVPGGEAIAFDCEWNVKEFSARIAALYVPEKDGSILALWLVSADDTPFEKLQKELSGWMKRYGRAEKLDDPVLYSAILSEHELSFRLSAKKAFDFQPRDVVTADHANFMLQIDEANPEFLISFARQWHDEKRGIHLSYQLAGTDVNLGPSNPFVHWLSGVFQRIMRVDKDKGDIPIELIHLEDARTEVVSDEELKAHFENNERAPEAGVILKVMLPRSPYARVCRLQWPQTEPDGTMSYGRAWFIELRDYHRSRSEIVTGAMVVMILAEAPTEEALDLLEASLTFTSRPLDPATRFPRLPE